MVGNYFVVQFFALLWGVQMLTPYWLGLKLCLVNHKSSKLPFIKSKGMAMVSIIGVPVAISFIYLLLMIIMMAIAQDAGNFDNFGNWYESSGVRLGFAILWRIIMTVMSLLSTIVLSVGISNMRDFFKYYQGKQSRITGVLITIDVF